MKHVIRKPADIEKLLEEISQIPFSETSPLVITIDSGQEKNTWPMKKTWRMWMAETADFLRDTGVTMPLLILKDGTPWGERPFDKDDAHELFTRCWVGVDAEGDRYKTASGDRGTMLHMMDKHLAWAIDRGLTLTIPKDGEYMQTKAETEA